MRQKAFNLDQLYVVFIIMEAVGIAGSVFGAEYTGQTIAGGWIALFARVSPILTREFIGLWAQYNTAKMTSVQTGKTLAQAWGDREAESESVA